MKNYDKESSWLTKDIQPRDWSPPNGQSSYYEKYYTSTSYNEIFHHRFQMEFPGQYMVDAGKDDEKNDEVRDCSNRYEEARLYQY